MYPPGIPGGLHAQAAGGVGVEQIGAQYAVGHQVLRRGRHPVLVEGGAAQPPWQEGFLADVHEVREDLPLQVVEQEALPAVNAGAGDGVHQMAHQPGRDLGAEQDRGLAGSNLSRPQAGDGTLAGAATDGLGGRQIIRATRGIPPVIPLHALSFLTEHRATDAVTGGGIAADKPMAVAVHMDPGMGGHGGAFRVDDALVRGAGRLLARHGQVDGVFDP